MVQEDYGPGTVPSQSVPGFLFGVINMDSFKTKAGTELPIATIKGKSYLQVAHRLVWFREEKPGWGIETEITSIADSSAIMKATIIDENGKTIATAHKHENAKGFADFMEKAETGAIGRALAACGYGTQFAPELDEQERIVDSPQVRGPEIKNMRASGPIAGTNAVGGVISDAQIKRLWAIARANKWPEENVYEQLGKVGLVSPTELNRTQYDHLCNLIEKHPQHAARTN